MTLDVFCKMHPKLFRLGVKGAHIGIERHGLLTAKKVAEIANIQLPQAARQSSIEVLLPDGTPVTITDNCPLSFKKLAPVLDDGLTPRDWLDMLNERVFFWPIKKLGLGNLGARRRLGYSSEWQIFDTRKVLDAVWDFAEISPINSGATVYDAVRRGYSTYALLDGLNYEQWKWSRKAKGVKKGPDEIKEVTVSCSIPLAGSALVDVVAAL